MSSLEDLPKMGEQEEFLKHQVAWMIKQAPY